MDALIISANHRKKSHYLVLWEDQMLENQVLSMLVERYVTDMVILIAGLKFNRFGFEFNFDTAGIRRKAKVKEDLEFYSMRSVRAIEHADICMMMLLVDLKVRIKVHFLVS
jgi:predicted GTPase